jgi:hypothetical protein
MPLEAGKSREAFSQNVKTEMAAGKPQKQAVAIAYSEKNRAEDGSVVGLHHDGRALVKTPHGNIPVPVHGLDREQVADYAKLLHAHADQGAAVGTPNPAPEPQLTVDNSAPFDPTQPQAPQVQLPTPSEHVPAPGIETEPPQDRTNAPNAVTTTPGNVHQVWYGKPTASLGNTQLGPTAERFASYVLPEFEFAKDQGEAADISTDSPTVTFEQALSPDQQAATDTLDQAEKLINDPRLSPAQKAQLTQSYQGALRRAWDMIPGREVPGPSALERAKMLLKPKHEAGGAVNEPSAADIENGPGPEQQGQPQPWTQAEIDTEGAPPGSQVDNENLAAAKRLLAPSRSGAAQAPAPPGAVPPSPSDRYAAAVAQVESQGGKLLKNPNPGSTSKGIYGFTDPTAKAVDKKYGLDASDPDIENKRLAALTAENAQILGTTDPVMLYAAHNSGAAAVNQARKEASDAGEPQNWRAYLQTPTGKGNSDPLQGQKALGRFEQAYQQLGQNNQIPAQPGVRTQETSPERVAGVQTTSKTPSGGFSGLSERFSGAANAAPGATPSPPPPSASGINTWGDLLNAISQTFAGTAAEGAGIKMGTPPEQALGAAAAEQNAAEQAAVASSQPPEVAPGVGPKAAPMPTPAPAVGGAASQQQTQPPAQAPAPPQPGVLASPSEAAGNVAAGLGEQAQGLAGQASAEAAGQREMSTELGAQATTQGQLYQDQARAQRYYQAQLQDLQTRSQNLIDQVAQSRIDPERWWSSRSAGQKVATLAGLFFGGQQSLERVQQFVANDIGAQKTDLENLQGASAKQLNLYGQMLDTFKSAPAATNAAQAALLAQFQDRLQGIAAKYNSPAIQYKAMQAIGLLQQQRDALMGQAFQQSIATHDAGFAYTGWNKLQTGSGTPDPYERTALLRDAMSKGQVEFDHAGNQFITSRKLTTEEHQQLAGADQAEQLLNDLNSTGVTDQAQAQSLVTQIGKSLGYSDAETQQVLKSPPIYGDNRPWGGAVQALRQGIEARRNSIRSQVKFWPLPSLYGGGPGGIRPFG